VKKRIKLVNLHSLLVAATSAVVAATGYHGHDGLSSQYRNATAGQAALRY
jgi:hypothetical protein